MALLTYIRSAKNINRDMSFLGYAQFVQMVLHFISCNCKNLRRYVMNSSGDTLLYFRKLISGV